MTIETKLVGLNPENDQKLEQSIHKKGEKPSGAVVYTEPFIGFLVEVLPFTNPINGTAMNINAAAGGIPAFIYEDGDNSNADSGTTDGTTANKLVDSSQNFSTTISVGMVVRNTTDTTFAHVTAVDSNSTLSLDSDIMVSGENYTIGAEWPGTAIAGAWNFVSNISITSAFNNDEAQFDNPHTSVMSNYVSVSGNVTLTTWNEGDNSLFISFGLAGVLVGNQINLNDFIDSSLLGVQQNFLIPKESLGLSTQTVDQMNIIVTRTGGARPTVDLDDIEFEQSGGPVTYKVVAAPNTIYHIDEIRLSLAGPVTGITAVAGATENATVPNLSYDKLLNINTLTNGIIFQRVEKSVAAFSLTLKQLGDFMAAGANLVNHISDGTNTFISLAISFEKAIVLDGDRDDFVAFIIGDDLSSLAQLTAVSRGGTEL